MAVAHQRNRVFCHRVFLRATWATEREPPGPMKENHLSRVAAVARDARDDDGVHGPLKEKYLEAAGAQRDGHGVRQCARRERGPLRGPGCHGTPHEEGGKGGYEP